VAETKEAGLRSYGVQTPEALAFFRMHGALDIHHARELLEALGRAVARGGTIETATRAVASSACAQWRFLDGVERIRQSRLAA
jgi:pyrroloquinoline quinone (PQQ) biosynthesis protein C